MHLFSSLGNDYVPSQKLRLGMCSQKNQRAYYKDNDNYLQQLCREIIEFLLYRGFPRPIWPAKYHERSEGYFAGQIGQGNPR